jgi:predicted nucleic acid-binding protein
VRIWDTSAVVPLLMREPRSAHAQELLERDEQMIVWWGTPVECWSALARLRREGVITRAVEDDATRRLELLSAAWNEVSPTEEVRLQCRRLLRVHRLRAGDALQLAAALIAAGSAADGELITADVRLAEIAGLEGLDVIVL